MPSYSPPTEYGRLRTTVDDTPQFPALQHEKAFEHVNMYTFRVFRSSKIASGFSAIDTFKLVQRVGRSVCSSAYSWPPLEETRFMNLPPQIQAVRRGPGPRFWRPSVGALGPVIPAASDPCQAANACPGCCSCYPTGMGSTQATACHCNSCDYSKCGTTGIPHCAS